MGIRLDQLHSEVFNKIADDMTIKANGVMDYLDNKISELDVVFGLPETTHVERDAEVNKRNLEKSGFIEINRQFVPLRTGDQAATGVWVSNLDTNESPFEAQTIDGQKRGINVAGHNINYTKGNIGQDISKMMNLPIAPNLPVFFPEDNNMEYNFQPVKTIIHQKNVTDTAIEITVNNRITDDFKIDLDMMIEADGSTKYYYIDDESNVYYLDEAGRTYIETDPDNKLVEAYNRYTVDFGQNFTFETIYNSNGVVQYIDPTDAKIFSIVPSTTTDGSKVDLTINDNQVFLTPMNVVRFVEEEGVLVEKLLENQLMLVKHIITTTTINGYDTETKSNELVSNTIFTVQQDDSGNDYITDNGVDMYLTSDNNHNTYFYYPNTRYVVVDGEETTDTEIDPNYVKYVTYENITDKTAMTVALKDSITNNDIDRAVTTVENDAISYFRLNTLITTNVGLVSATINNLGNYVEGTDVNNGGANVNRPVKITEEGTLTTMSDGSVKVYSAGKEFYYHHEVGTKYYLTDTSNIYYLDANGGIHTPDNDVQEIFNGTLNNVDTATSNEITIYVANGLTYFINSEALRTYIEDEIFQQIQLTDVNGYKVFKKISDGTLVYAYVGDTGLKFVTITNDVESVITITYNDITPVFETAEVEEDVLNLIIPISFNIIQGNIVLKRNDQALAQYSDYEIEGILSLSKSLEFNEETNEGDTLYIKRMGKKDIVLRLEKIGTLAEEQANITAIAELAIDATDEEKEVAANTGITTRDWTEDKGKIVIPEPLTGNSFKWTDGQDLLPGEQLDYNDIVKKEDKFFQYTGSALAYEDMPADNKTIVVQEAGVFWEDVTVMELEYERKGQNYRIIQADKGDTIRFTIVRYVWEQNVLTGEMEVAQKAPYTIERIAANDGENVIVIEDQNFLLDDNAILESYILMLENIKDYSTYENNRANDFTLVMTGLQTVALNTNPAMIYGEDYNLAKNVLFLNDANMTDSMNLLRIQAPQAELKIVFDAVIEQPKVVVPFDINKNKFDIVIPTNLDGHEYTWIMGETIPEGKSLLTGDVIFDKVNTKFYKFVGQPKTDVNGDIVTKRTLLRLSENVQKEILRQYMEIDDGGTENWFSEFDIELVKEAKIISDEAEELVSYWTTDDEGNDVLVDNATTTKYKTLAIVKLITAATHILNTAAVEAFVGTETDIMSPIVRADIIEILNTDLDQKVLKLVTYNEDNLPVLDENGDIVYNYRYTRNFMVEVDVDGYFVQRTIAGAQTELTNTWEDITVEEVGYYRFGKTFTIIDTKDTDQIVVRLLSTGAEEFTSKRVISEGGEITFPVDFNIEEEDGSEIPFEVIYEEISWIEGLDYIQENQTLTLTMVEEIGQSVVIRRNDDFNLIDIVVLERKDLAFVEVWHEAVNETGYIFPFGNVQYQGTTSDNIMTNVFDHVFVDTIDGEESIIPDGNKKYCQVYQKGNVVYNYYAGTEFDAIDDVEKKIIDESFVEDGTIGRGWKLEDLTDEEKRVIFQNPDHNLYFNGEKLVQIRYRTRVVALNLFNNFFKGTSDYMSEGLRFQGKSPVTSRIVTREIGEDPTGEPLTETIQVFAGDKLVISSSSDSLLYKEGKLYDDALFTVEEPTDLSDNGYVHAIPVAIVNRRNQGVYHPEFNENGTGFFINGIHVSEDIEDFADDISGFTLVDENAATLETSSVGRDRKAKFKVMLEWLFSGDYKAGGSMISKTTYRPDGLLYDEINTRDIIDLRIDANDQRKRIEDLEADVIKGFNELTTFQDQTGIKFEQTVDYVNTTANLLYSHIAKTEATVREDMNAKDAELTAGLELTNTNLADLSANVFTKDVSTNLLIDTIVGLTDYNKTDAFLTDVRPSRDDIAGMINSFVENMEGPYTKAEFMKFLVTVLKSIVNKNMLSDDSLDRWIRRLSVKDLAIDADTEIYSRAETLELIYEGLILASGARILPPIGSDVLTNWVFEGKRYDGWLGTKHLELKGDFIDNGKTPLAVKNVNVANMTKTYTDRLGKVWNKGYIAGPTVWGNVHNYHAIYTTFIFVENPFKIDYVKMNGDDPHAIFINEEKIATNKYCCRDTAYSYDFAVPGWYRIDAVYSERGGGHSVQLGWNPKDYVNEIKYMTTTNMDEAVRITKLRLDNWASKTKSLVSTIKGDATGYFTKLETKLILIEGLQRINNHILTNGTAVTDSDLVLFHGGDATNPGLESWIDNINNDGKFTSLGYEIQEGTDENGTTYTRSDEFRPVIDLTGYYNKEESIEIIRKMLQLVNGIDSISSGDIQKWVDRLNISITMATPSWFTVAQINAIITAGTNYLAGLDSVTSYEIADWLNFYITDTYGEGADDVTLDNDEDESKTKEVMKTDVAVSFKAILGAQSATSSN